MINEVDRLYILGHKKWLEENDLTIKELEVDKEHDHNLIAILSDRIRICQQRIQLTCDYGESTKEAFKVWLENNKISPEDLIGLL